MRGRELERVFFLFGVGPVGMREEESFLSLLVSLRECEEDEMESCFLLMCGPMGLTKGT